MHRIFELLPAHAFTKDFLGVILHITPLLHIVKKLILPNSNNSPTRCNSFTVYYPDVYLQLNMFWAFSRPSSGAE